MASDVSALDIAPQRGLLAAVGIVKNEAHTIKNTLESVKGVVDKWVWLDTGSTDGTPDLIRSTMRDVPGKLAHGEFIDYSQARNDVLDLHDIGNDPAVFTLMLSADETLHSIDKTKSVANVIREYLETKRDTDDEAFHVEVRIGSTTWTYPRVLRAGTKCRYEGDIQEVIIDNRKDKTKAINTIPGVYIEHKATDIDRRTVSIKTSQIPLLKIALEKDPADTRAMMFLAQNYEAMSYVEPENARGYNLNALELYRRRIAIKPSGSADDIAEINYAELHEIICELKLGGADGSPDGEIDGDKVLSRLYNLVSRDPSRPETRYILAGIMANKDIQKGYNLAVEAAAVAEYAKKYPKKIPVDTDCVWRSWLLAATCAYHLAKPDVVKACVDRGLETGGPKEDFKQFIAEWKN